ncbi:MAG: ribosome silencing factor [Candidatus Omnitrophica bacterium]|nr:ribosome silencing factor [Candidatus Omnitrophota bacterium]
MSKKRKTKSLKRKTPRVKGLKDAVTICKKKKAEDVVILDMRKLCSFTEYFVIASGESTVQIKAILNEIIKSLKKKKVKINHTEGREGGRWVILDAGHFVVHLFVKELREFYDLELLWADAPRQKLGLAP